MNRIFTNMKKMAKTFSFWFVILALVGIYMHQIGQDSKSIVLISINLFYEQYHEIIHYVIDSIRVCK